MAASKSATRSQRIEFWCAEKGRTVCVEFAQKGPLLFRRETEILSCSAFDDPSLINCRRQCLDPVYRRGLGPRWEAHGY